MKDFPIKIDFRKLSGVDLIPDDLIMIREQLINNTNKNTFSEIYIAHSKKDILGGFVLQSSEYSILLKTIEVHKFYRKNGIGDFLLKKACEKAKQLGYDEIELSISNADINLLHFFQKKGFDIKSLKRNFFNKDGKEQILKYEIAEKHLIVLVKDL